MGSREDADLARLRARLGAAVARRLAALAGSLRLASADGGAGAGPPAIRVWPPTPSAVTALAGLGQFSEADFRTRLAGLYHRVGTAWREHRLGDLEADVTVDLMAAWTAAVPAASPPLTVPIGDVTARIVEAGADGGYERVTVCLDGGEQMDAPLLQYWTLERASPDAPQGRTCPGCGAPLTIDDLGRCASCQATIDLGRPAWVLARVESARDWGTRQATPDQGTLTALDTISAADPGFHPDVFADRVMALYPRLMLAIREPRSALARVAIAQALRGRLLEAQVQAGLSAWRTATSTTGISGAAISHALRWSRGDAITVDLSRHCRPGDVPVVDRWTFVRPPGVRTSLSGGVLAECCTVCAAPIDIDDAGCCSHCGTDITLGTHDWTLTAIRPWPAPAARLPDLLEGTIVSIEVLDAPGGEPPPERPLTG